MKTNRERAVEAANVWWNEPAANIGTLMDAIESALNEAGAAEREAIACVLDEQRKRFMPSEGAYHVLTSIARDHIRARGAR